VSDRERVEPRGYVVLWGRAWPVPVRLDVDAERILVRTPVADAEVPCPQCGADAWEAVEVRAEPDAERTRWRIVVCGACNTIADRSAAGRRRTRRRPIDSEEERWIEESRAELRDLPDQPEEIIAQAGFAVYGMTRSLVRATRLASWSREQGRIVEVELAHRARIGRRTSKVCVVSSVDDLSRRARVNVAAMFALGQALDGLSSADDPAWKDLSDEARLLRRAERARAEDGRDRAQRATFNSLAIPIGRRQEPVMVARDQAGVWAGVSVIDGVTVTVSGTAFDPGRLQLDVVADPSRYLEPPRSSRRRWCA